MPDKVPVHRKRRQSQRTDTLQNFAKRIEQRMLAAKGTFAMEQLVCRLLTGKDPRIAAIMAARWTEWRYGRVPETSITVNQPVMVIVGATEHRMKALKTAAPQNNGSRLQVLLGIEDTQHEETHSQREIMQSVSETGETKVLEQLPTSTEVQQVSDNHADGKV